MIRPIIPDFAREELRSNPNSKYSKRITKQIEEWKVLRDGGRAIDEIAKEIEKPIKYVIELINKAIR